MPSGRLFVSSPSLSRPSQPEPLTVPAGREGRVVLGAIASQRCGASLGPQPRLKPWATLRGQASASLSLPAAAVALWLSHSCLGTFRGGRSSLLPFLVFPPHKEAWAAFVQTCGHSISCILAEAEGKLGSSFGWGRAPVVVFNGKYLSCSSGLPGAPSQWQTGFHGDGALRLQHGVLHPALS